MLCEPIGTTMLVLLGSVIQFCIPDPGPPYGDAYSFLAIHKQEEFVAALELDEDISDGISVVLDPLPTPRLPQVGDAWLVTVTALKAGQPPVASSVTKIRLFENWDANGDNVIGARDFVSWRVLGSLLGPQFLRFRKVFGMQICEEPSGAVYYYPYDKLQACP